jgi:tetratricopeptide (TPR) repeat protein
MKRFSKKRSHGRFLLFAAVLGFFLLLFSGCPTTNGLYGQAYLHFVNRDEARALELLGRIIEREARYTPAYVLEAAIYEGRGNWNKSEEILLAAQKQAPPSPVVCFNLGNIYFKKGEYRQAADQYSRALTFNPGFTEAYINRANSLMAAADYEAALRDYEKFLSLAPKEYPNVRELVRLLRRELKLDPAEGPAATPAP